MSLTLTVEELSPHSAVVTLNGPLLLGMSLSIADGKVRSLLEQGVNRLILDMTAVPYCDSAGLGAIIYNHGLAKQQGGMLRICGVSSRVAAMLKMTSADTFLMLDDDRAASVAALASPAA